MPHSTETPERDIGSMYEAELTELLAGWNEPKYRAKQLFGWLAKSTPALDMTNLSRSLRERIAELPYYRAEIERKLVSDKDGTVKYLFSLYDGNMVEGVLMRYNYGNTLCISTQVGCRMGCAFCASTLNGCVRNITAGEMLSFIGCVERDVPHGEDAVRTVTNIVLMGSGEPLDNFDNVVRFLHLVSDENGLNISPRNISLSTCGLVPMMDRLAGEAPHVTLSLSLHAPNDAIRSRIMPVNARWGVDEALGAAKRYAQTTGRRVIIEYALISGLNSDERQAAELAAKLKGINCHVNLIPLNDVPERSLKGVNRAEAERFMDWLNKRGISATIRREMGADIQGACGQLRRHVLEGRES